MNRYQLVKAEDGIVWCPIQPLMLDIQENLDKLKTIVYDGDDKRELDMRILGLEAIGSFLGALLTEQKLTDLREQHGKEQTNPTTLQ